jgi:hypothetical protein
MGVLREKNIYLKSKIISEKVFYKKEMTLQDPQISKVVISDSSKYVELERIRKINSITRGYQNHISIKY